MVFVVIASSDSETDNVPTTTTSDNAPQKSKRVRRHVAARSATGPLQKLPSLCEASNDDEDGLKTLTTSRGKRRAGLKQYFIYQF